MPNPIAYGDDADLLVLPGSPLGGIALVQPGGGVDVVGYNILAQIIIAPAVDDGSFFRLPDLYLYYPEVIRRQDFNLVDRPDVPLYTWDSVPAWDETPFTWDEVIGPEPILKATTRVMQIELERTAQDICRILTLNDLDRTPRSLLPYIATGLGTPLPSAGESQQRSFLKSLAQTYRKKGTPLSFFRLFESLGFTLTLRENYQRKEDAALVGGPQMALVSTDLVQDESIGTTSASTGPYSFQFSKTPVVRGSVKIQVFDQSTNTPRIIVDNGNGGWSDGISGSINYPLGVGSFTLPTTPTLIGQSITATYRFFADPFPDPFNLRWTNRYRSSIVSVALTPKDSSVNLTAEVNDRLLLYLNLLKPAHVVVRALDIIFNLSEDESVNLSDDLSPIALLHADSLFGTLYRGLGWSASTSGARNPNPVFATTPHRNDHEFQIRWDGLPDTTRSPGAPYHYPFLRNGKFTQPSASNNYESDWFETNVVFNSTVTSDTARTTTSFSISKGAGTALGVGDHVAFKTGPDGGESRIIDTFTDNGTHYTVTVAVAFPVAPTVSDQVAVIDINSPNRRNLKAGFREQDPVNLKFGEFLTPSPDGVSVGPFTVTITASHRPLVGTTILRYVRGGVTREETATGTGAFTNVNGNISASSVNYTTGAVSVTFDVGEPPDAATQITILSSTASSNALGEF